MGKIKLIFFFALLIGLLIPIDAQPPFQQSDTSIGLVLETGTPTSHKLNEDYYIHVHVYNASSGLLLNEGLTCYYHFYNHQINGGEHISIGTLGQYGAGYNNTVDGSLINQSGEYSSLVWCNSSDFGGFFKNTFEVTGGGATPTTAQAIMYGIILLILLILFLGCFIYFLVIPWGHYKSSEGAIVEVNHKRTMKIIMFFLSYLLMLFILFVGKAMTESYMFLDDTPVFFDIFFMILLVSIAPVLICVVALIILETISNTKLQDAILRGLNG